MATESEANALGFTLPGPADLIRDGDDAIKANALAAVDLYLSLNAKYPLAIDAATRAEAAAELAEQISGLTGEDDAVALLAETPGTALHGALSATYAARAATVVRAYDYGLRAGTGTPQNAALAAAFQAAKDATGGATVELPPGVITIEGSFPLAGYSAGLRGAGGSNTAVVGRTGTVLRCINQTGAVLDFTGYRWPADQIGRVVFEGFTIEGDLTASPTKVKRGIYSPVPTDPLGLDYPNCYTFRDITIRRCGGAGIEMSDTYFGLWENVVLCDPVDVVANDVPYAKVTRGNGTVYINVGLRSQIYEPNGFGSHPGDVGASGAFILDGGDDLTHIYTRGVMLGCWAENLHIPSNGCIVSSKTMSVAHRDWSFFDCFKVKDATSTAFIHLAALPPSAEGLARHGGNEVAGIIEGQTAYHDANPKVWIDHGVRDSQGGNNIHGAKGWAGNNVLLDAGVKFTRVELAGGERVADNSGWVDNSGNFTNTLIDTSRGVYIYGNLSDTLTTVQRRSYARATSPEGNVTAPIGAECVTDPAQANGASKWFKASRADQFGWEVIKGRTGRRTVSADLMNGWTDPGQPLVITRTGDSVTIAGQLVRGTADQFMTIPLGFRPTTTVRQPVRYGGTTVPQTVATLLAAASAAYVEGGTGAASVYVNVTWTTADPWPTTLPGLNSSGGTSWISG